MAASGILTTRSTPAEITSMDTSLQIHWRHTGHRYAGFGANIWPGDPTFERVCQTLNMTWVRLWTNFHGDAPGPDVDYGQLDAHWSLSPGNDALRATAGTIRAHRLNTVLCLGAPPTGWLGTRKELLPEYHSAFVRLWGSVVRHHVRMGVTPRYIELYNEPDGDWSVHVSAIDNSRLISQVRDELDRLGFRHVGICGPGTARADWGESGDAYIHALDTNAVKALSAWSNHAWEWNAAAINTPEGRMYLRSAWESIRNSIRKRDPAFRRPILVTEFATKATQFHGKRYRDPGAGLSHACASDTHAYAIRVLENAMHLLNGGANALMVWECADQEWSGHEWGLLTRPSRGSAPRPVFHALASVFPLVPVPARVLLVTHSDLLTAGAFRSADRLTIVLVNGDDCNREVRCTIHPACSLKQIAWRSYPALPAPRLHANVIEATLSPDSVLSATFLVDR